MLSWERLFETLYILNEGFLENLVSPGRPEKLYEKMYAVVPVTYECKTYEKCKTEKYMLLRSTQIKKIKNLKWTVLWFFDYKIGIKQTQIILPVNWNGTFWLIIDKLINSF